MSAASRLPTAALAAAGLIAGFAAATVSGSRPLGGVVLAAFGLTCIATWRARHRAAKTVLLTAIGLLAFALSHGLGLLIGAWPAVLLSAALTATVYWRASDVVSFSAGDREPR